jgi:hypothetical protein
MKLVRLVKMCLNNIFSQVYISNHTSDNFHIQSDLKQGDALSPLLFNFPLGYVLTEAHRNQVGLRFNEICQLLSYADDVNPLGENIVTRKKSSETLFYVSSEVGVEVNAEKMKYTLLSRHQNAG